MSSTELVKVMLVVCWVLLGIGLVLYVWRRQAKAADSKKAQINRENAAKLEELYNFLVQRPEGVTMSEITQLLMVDENQAAQYLGQLEANGIVRQTTGEGGSSLFSLNKDSEFNLF